MSFYVYISTIFHQISRVDFCRDLYTHNYINPTVPTNQRHHHYMKKDITHQACHKILQTTYHIYIYISYIIYIYIIYHIYISLIYIYITHFSPEISPYGGGEKPGRPFKNHPVVIFDIFDRV